VNNPQKQNILITGGTGFAGRYAIKRLLSGGHNIFALVRSSEKLTNVLGQEVIGQNGLKIIENGLAEKSSTDHIKKLIEELQITTIVHIGALAREYSSTPWNDYFETNVTWTRNLASAFLEANVNHDKFVYTSTVGVYGTIPLSTPADEETPYNPDGKYHKSKMLAEQELLKLKSESNLPLVIVRPSIMYGVGDFGFLYKIFKLSKKKVYPLSSNNPQFHMLDVETLAEVYARLIEQQNPAYDILNVCDKEPIAAKTLLNFIKTSTQSSYLTVPSSFFSLLKAISRLNAQRSITFKLINESWCYDVRRLHQTIRFEPKNTIGNLEGKYLTWYEGCA
jgi:nucleoside-diphosphate-sugar epimerase